MCWLWQSTYFLQHSGYFGPWDNPKRSRDERDSSGSAPPPRADSPPPRRPAAPPAFRGGSPRPRPPPPVFRAHSGHGSQPAPDRPRRSRDGGGGRAPSRAESLPPRHPAGASRWLPAPPRPPRPFLEPGWGTALGPSPPGPGGRATGGGPRPFPGRFFATPPPRRPSGVSQRLPAPPAAPRPFLEPRRGTVPGPQLAGARRRGGPRPARRGPPLGCPTPP